MSLIATLTLAASTGAVLPQCNWDRPGVNPFMGDVVAAVDRYQDIPADTRAKLKARMQTRSYDDIVVIERDRIHGKAAYAPEITDMHFGAGSVCRTVTRARWTANMQERGLVYCEDGHCILVPTVCRNVSRIRRAEPVASAKAAPATPAEDTSPLEFEPPAAGPVAAAGTPETFASASGVPSLGSAPSDGGGMTFGGGGGTPGSFGGGGGAPGPSFGGGGIPALPPATARPTETPVDVPIDSTPPVRPPVTPPDLPVLPPVIPPAVPEPGSWALIAMGLLVVAYRARRRFDD
jgi:hypothetical protein